jgi:hypothetical protein
VLWLLPWAALAPRRWPRLLAVAQTAYLLMIWAPAGLLPLRSLRAHAAATRTGRANDDFLLSRLR